MHYRICEYCGAALDPGERCDCISCSSEKETKKENTSTKEAFSFKQLSFNDNPFYKCRTL